MKTGFSVMRFTIERMEDGTCMQKVLQLGDFPNIETAFNTARTEALRELNEACRAESIHVPAVRKIQLRDTEWGYELKREHQIVARYWVHDGQPAELNGING
ncbi:MAG TPA: hypothetical protein VFJ90_11085 [Candidatus Didemnitutus sp.]|nr:hypothetical protein [Candidatus Didemnitutus sp.]